MNAPWNDTGNASSLPAQDLEWNSHVKLDQHCVHVLTQLPIIHFNRGKAQMKATFQLEAMTSSHLGGGRLAMPLLCTVSFSCAYVCFEKFNHSIPPPLKLSLSHPYRESKVQSEVRVPKVILAGRCSKSSAVTGTVVVRAVRGRGGISLR